MINPNHYGIVELGLTAVVVLGVAFYQLWSVRRSIRQGHEGPRKD